ncbi:VCBS domain-containing protein [Rhizobacter fulvus]
MHALHLGDLVHRGDVILTSQNGIVQLTPDDGAPVARAVAAPATPEIDRVITGLNQPEPTDATAAGLTGGDSGDLLPGLRVARITEAVTPASMSFPDTSERVFIEPIGVAEREAERAIAADTTTIQAFEEGAPVNLGLAAPTGISEAAVIRVTQLPLIGELVKSDGTPVTIGSVLTPGELTGLTYVPPTDYTPGTPVGLFRYTVTDGGVTVPGGVVIDLAPVNDAPIGQPDTVATLEDTPVSGNVLGNDSDVDGDPLTLTQYTIDGVSYPAGTSATIPGIGTLTIGPDGSYTFVPAPNYNGPVPPVTYTLTDGTVTTTSTLTITVGAVNDTPVAIDDQVTTPINTPVSIPVLSNDTDPDGDPLTLTTAVLSNPAQGTITVNADGTLDFTPATDVTGPVVISYTVTDGQGGTATATVTVTVGPNTAPTGTDSVHTIAEDGSYTVQVADFGYADGDAGQTFANVRIETLPGAGTLLLNGVAVTAGALIPVAVIAAGQLVFVPVADANGSPYASFTFSVQDSAGAFDAAPNALTINVTPVPDAAVIGGVATGATVEDTTLTTGGTLTVVDPDAGEAAFQPQTGIPGAHGSFSIDAAGVWTYTLNNADPAVQALGAGQTLPNEVFTVRSVDGTTSQVTVTITGTDDAPVISAGVGAVTENTSPTVSGTLTATDVDNPTLAFVPATISGSYGSLVLQSNGQWTYTLDARAEPLAQGQVVSEPITVTLNDGSTTTVTITVTGTNDAPIASNDIASTPINTAVSNIPVLPNDTDPDGDPLTVTTAVLTNPAQGTVTVNPDGTLNFTPATNVTGPVVISYTISDGQGGTSTATVTVNVGSNTPPTGADSTHAINEDGSYTVTTADFGFADADAGQTLAGVRIDTLPAAGTLLLNGVAVAAGAVISAADIAAGLLVFKPIADANGSPYANFTFSVQDSAGAFDTVPNTLTINVTPVPDTAVIGGNATGATVEDTTLTTGGTLTVVDPDAGEAAFQPQTGIAGAHGSFSIDAAGVWTYTLNNADPAVQALGAGQMLPSEVFTVQSLDGTTSQVTVTITGTDDAPVISSGVGAVTENTSPSTSGILTATDVDNPALAFVPATISGSYGSLVLQSNGQWTYTLDARAEPLAQGQVVSEPITVTLNDGSTTTVTITVTGTNDAAVIGGVATGATVEDTTLTTGGTLTVVDPDAGQSSFQPQTAIAGAHGTFSIDAAGVWTYTLNNADPAVQALGAGQTLPSEVFTVQSLDGTTSQVTVTITGTDDAPVISSGVGAVTENTSPSTSGTLTATDVDNPALAFVPATISGSYGSLVLQSNGQWTYTLDARAEPLAQGQVVSEPITVTLNDGSTTTVTITVTGTNDAAVIGGVATGATVEDTTLTTGGTLTVSDADVGQSAFLPQTSIAGAHGSFSIDAAGVWTYTLNNADPAVQALGAGQTLPNEVFTVRSVDGTTSQVTVTITGTDDAPVISAGVGAVTENTSPTVSGTLTATDVDNPTLAFVPATISGSYGSLVLQSNGQWTYTLDARAEPLAQGQVVSEPITVQLSDGSTTTVTITVTGTNDLPVISGPLTGTVKEDTTLVSTGTLTIADPDAGQSSFIAQAGTPGTYGTFALTAAGVWTYTLNNAAANVQSLPATASLTESFTVTSADGSSTRTVVVTVNGTNDVPTSPGASFTVAEDAPVVSGSVTGSDVDTGAVLSFALTGAAPAGLTFNSNGSYTFDPSNAAYQSLAAGQSQVVTVPYQVIDDRGASSLANLVITVTGVDDAPMAVSDSTIAVEAGGVANAIAGTNPSGNVLTNDTDVDVGDTKTVSAVSGIGAGIVGGSTTGLYGTLTLDASGNYTYAVNNSLAAVQALRTAGNTLLDTFSYTVRDAAGLTSTTTLQVTIQGANDAPVAVADAASVTEDVLFTSVAPGVLGNDTDVDAGDTRQVTGVAFGATSGAVSTPLTGTYGTLTMQADGSYTYLANRPAAEALAAGQTATEQFTYTMRDTAGATSSTTLTLTITGTNDAPTVTSGAVTGTEDTPLVLTWANFGVSDVDSANSSLSIKISTLPVSGTLQHFDGTSWTAVAAGSSFTYADVNAGNLRFAPALNASGTTGYAAGLGNMKADYAQFTYTASDGSLTSNTGTMTLDIAPVADAPTLSLTTASFLRSSSLDELTSLSGPNAWTRYATDMNGGAWRTNNTGGTIEVYAEGEYLQNGSSNRVIELESNAGAASNLYTDVSTKAGQVYHLSFDFAERLNNQNIGSQGLIPAYGTAQMDVFWGGVKVATLNTDTSEWTHFELDLAAAATGTTRLTFQATDSNSLGGVMDNLSLQLSANTMFTNTTTQLPQPSVALVDTDGSEALALAVTGIPIGASISDGTHSFTATAGNQVAMITGWTYSALTVTPPAGYTGSFTLNYKATSTETLGGSVATTITPVTLNVIAPNTAPVAFNDAVTAIRDVVVHGNVLTNDTDADGHTLYVTGFTVNGTTYPTYDSVGVLDNTTDSVTIAGVGYFRMEADGNYQFTPLAGYTGTAPAISYTVADEHGGYSTATLTLTETTTGGIMGGNGADLLNGTAGADVISASGGNDTLNGLGGNDVLAGGTGNDILIGGAGSDVLWGGAGSDTLTGGTGTGTDTSSNTFAWTLNEQGTSASPAVDTITDFNKAAASSGGDVLDLRDLLIGEYHNAFQPNGNLTDFLHFTTSAGTTTIEVKSHGVGTSSADEKIVLTGVDLTNGGALNTDQLIIQDLLSKGKLVVD